eukprot:8637957-Pyramimonas_sp.AAC.1
MAGGPRCGRRVARHSLRHVGAGPETAAADSRTADGAGKPAAPRGRQSSRRQQNVPLNYLVT